MYVTKVIVNNQKVNDKPVHYFMFQVFIV